MQAAELEQRAERAVRRGELLVAIEHFEAYLAQQPDDERVRQRMESVRALLQPSELVSRRRSEPDEPPGPAPEPAMTDAEQGEMYAGSGRFKDAIAAYQRAVVGNPDNELLKERLAELSHMLAPAAPADLERGEKLEAAASHAAHHPGARSAKASAASFAPIQASLDLPRDPRKLLEALLGRVQRGRRK